MLRVETWEKPLGLTLARPVLGWKLAGTGEKTVPRAFQVQVASSPDLLRAGSCHWDSRWVESASNEIAYAGPAARSRQRSWWRVRVRDQDGNTSAWSEIDYWETGLLSREDWTAKWITTRITGGKRTCAPAPYLRRAFSLVSEPVKARLYVTALGLYECEINGQRVGEDCLNPGWTDYSKRVQVQTYDVTAWLHAGENALGAILGDGWYCGFVNNYDRQNYGLRPSLLVQLEIEQGDGTILNVVSDETWRYSSGPILENDLLMGESYDARLELGKWSSPGFDETNWLPVELPSPSPHLELGASAAPRVRRHEVFTGSHLNTTRDSWKRQIYDLGQNIAGRVRITVRGPRGCCFQLRHGEVLDAQGRVYTDNLRTARSIDLYVCGGDGGTGDQVETWEPRFTFHGFRYVEVASNDPDAQIVDVAGVALYSSIEPTGRFTCSSPLLNQFFQNIGWSMKGNFLEVPTDCPQRDERMGWTGDAQAFISTACFLHDVRGFFEKWALDQADAQQKNGEITAWAPCVNTKDDCGPAWADAVVICPWEIYRRYGDARILEQNYPTMRRFLDFVKNHRCKDGIRSHPDVDAWGGNGDWLALDGSTSWEGNTPKDLIGTAFLAHDLDLMARIAQVLGKPEDAAAFDEWRREVVRAFRRRFVTEEGLVVGRTQTAYVLALKFELLPEAMRPVAARELVRDIEKRGWHLSTGFVGTPHLCQVLEDNGHLDVAYRLLEQESFPSWLFPVKNGATTIWERWDGWTPEKGFQNAAMNSFNHYAYGAVGAWMVRTVAGLDIDERQPGGSIIVFRPRPGGTITHAEAEWRSARGVAGIRWELKEADLHLELIVPAYATASLDLPAGWKSDRIRFLPGKHRLVACRPHVPRPDDARRIESGLS